MWLFVITLSLIYTEFVGYLVHRILHVGWFPKLTESHQEHHNLYPPGAHQILDQYVYKQKENWVDQIGLEWILPIAAITIPVFLILLLLGVEFKFLAVCLVVGLLWAWVGFTYMHKSLHLKNFWMKDSYVFGSWYREMRRLHSIHHNNVKTNFGIVFYWFDKLYETFSRELKK